MIGTTGDQTDVLATQAEKARVEGLVALTFHLAEAKLVLLAGTPCVHDTFLITSKTVVGARSDVDDLLETREEDRSGLHECTRLEA